MSEGVKRVATPDTLADKDKLKVVVRECKRLRTDLKVVNEERAAKEKELLALQTNLEQQRKQRYDMEMKLSVPGAGQTASASHSKSLQERVAALQKERDYYHDLVTALTEENQRLEQGREARRAAMEQNLLQVEELTKMVNASKPYAEDSSSTGSPTGLLSVLDLVEHTEEEVILPEVVKSGYLLKTDSKHRMYPKSADKRYFALTPTQLLWWKKRSDYRRKRTPKKHIDLTSFRVQPGPQPWEFKLIALDSSADRSYHLRVAGADKGQSQTTTAAEDARDIQDWVNRIAEMMTRGESPE